jgi:CubicO group peptidase (beta-lactamase class C family)
MKVGVETGDKFDLIAANKAITIQDLLRHTSGLTYAFTGNSAVQRLYRDSQLFAPDPTNTRTQLVSDLTTAEFITALAKLPLVDQPGAVWNYSHSTDVIGRLIEVLSGQSLGAFFQERILAPLGMHDTFFLMLPDKYERVAEPFDRDPDTGKPVQLIEKETRQRFESAGGGLWSTMDDYTRFVRMLYLGGTLAFMASDHLGPNVRNGTPALLAPGHGFGLGFCVRLVPGMASTPGTPGEFYWGGLAGTAFWIAPQEELVAMMMIQGPGQRDYYRQMFRNMVHAALI